MQGTGHITDARDVIRVNDLALAVAFADGSRWPAGAPHTQPVLLTLSAAHDVRCTAETDDLAHSLNYSALAARVAAVAEAGPFASLEAFADAVCAAAEDIPVTVRVARTKALLYAERFGVEVRTGAGEERFFVEGMLCNAVLGIHPHERERRQRVRVGVELVKVRSRAAPLDFRTLERVLFDYVEASQFLTVEALASALARIVLVHSGDESARATVRVSKPSALLTAESSEVEVTRVLADFLEAQSMTANSIAGSAWAPYVADWSKSIEARILGTEDGAPAASLPHVAAIALGANIGDRFANIELALRLLETPRADVSAELGSGESRVVVVDTSFMYETAPMYVTDQPKFINAACIVETDLEPRALLQFLKEIEAAVGRVASIRNGPRAIDLDIVLYDEITMDTREATARQNLENLAGELVIPHPRLGEREFVLRPLADMIPDFIPPTFNKTIETLLDALPPSSPAMEKVVPFPRYPVPAASPWNGKHPSVPPFTTHWSFPVTPGVPGRHTYIMATLNATPDSFSDGALHFSLPDAVAYTTASVAAGADIIDIGGYSTRPGAAFVPPEEELARVVPVVQAIRGLWRDDAPPPTPPPGGVPQLEKTASTLLSVDTFRWAVAEEAIHAGANCINDVHAFAGPEHPPTAASAAHLAKMRAVARTACVPAVLMHSRGPAASNKDYAGFAYARRGTVLEAVRVELGARVRAAVKGRGGMRRWAVIVDPGIGFSKDVGGNVELLRGGARIVGERFLDTAEGPRRRNPLAGFPVLVGASRKSFLGALLERPDGVYEGRQTRADERDFATAAAVGCAVQQGAGVVRVHDVRALGDVVRVAAALYA